VPYLFPKEADGYLTNQCGVVGKYIVAAIGQNAQLPFFEQPVHVNTVRRFNNISVARYDHHRDIYFVEYFFGEIKWLIPHDLPVIDDFSPGSDGGKFPVV